MQWGERQPACAEVSILGRRELQMGTSWDEISPGHGQNQWIGLRENLQETIDFPIKYRGFPVNFPLNQSSDKKETFSDMSIVTICAGLQILFQPSS